MICPNCKKELEAGAKFCDECGTPLNEAEELQKESKVKEVSKTDTTSKSKKKINMVPLIVLAGIVIVVFGISKLFGGGATDYAMYIKDGEIFYTDFGKNAKQVTENLLDGSEMYSGFSSEIGIALTNSEDGNHIIYPDKMGYDGAEFFYKNLSKKNAKAVKIDSDMWGYAVNEKFDCITYCEGYGGGLYQHNLKEKEKIGRDVTQFDVSPDGKKVVYLTTDNDFYLWEKGKESEKIVSEMDRLYTVSQDLSTIYYEKEGNFYKQVIGQEKEKIDSEYKEILKIYDSGEVYYIKEEIVDSNLVDYVEDDMKAADDANTEPVLPEVPSRLVYPSDEEYNAAYQVYEQKREEYNEMFREYMSKISRETLRQQLNNYYKRFTKLCLYYYDGKTSTLVSDALESYSGIMVAENAPVVVIRTYAQNDIEKVKLSEITYIEEVDNLVHEALYSDSEYCVAVKNAVHVVYPNEVFNVNINDSGSTLYFIDNHNSDYEGDLYQVKINGNKVEEPKLLDTDVKGTVAFLSDDAYIYGKDVNYDSADIFMNGDEIDYDAYVDKLYLDENTGYIYYFTDWDGAMGTLKRYKNGESEKISDDVHMYHVTSEGTLIYLYDYDSYDQVGDMYLYNNGKPKMIAEDVNGIITDATELDDSERGFNYGW